MQVQKNC